MPEERSNINIRTEALNSGRVRLRITEGDRTLVDGELLPEQITPIVAALLMSAETSFRLSGAKLPENVNLEGLPAEIPATSIIAAVPKNRTQRTIVVVAGAGSIPFVIPEAKVYELAIALKQTVSGRYSSRGLLALLRRIFVEFFGDLRGWGGVFKARASASSRRLATSFWSAASGRSVRIFRDINISPGLAPPAYAPVGHCIYCDAKVYSTVVGHRRGPFGAEHIIAEGLGGTLELPEASCKSCEDATGRVTEGDVLGNTLKALRVHLNLRKRGKGPHPKVLPLEVTIDGKSQKMDLPTEEYPVVFMMPIYHPPQFVPNAAGPGKAITGATAAILKNDQTLLLGKYRISGFAAARWDNLMLCRMLAKIGHSLAIAELGEGRFVSAHLPLIRFGDSASISMVGCLPSFYKIRRSNALHELRLGYQRHHGKTYLVALVRLFANHSGPVYQVILGESLETPIVRFKRVFSTRTLRMLAR